MRGFLNEVAERLYTQYGADISSIKLILPSRRSRLFFTEALSEVATEPLWQPTSLSLDDLIGEASNLHRGESIRLISELYKSYSQYLGGEDFDKFYFWGEILLSDFDMIDKYLVDADKLFSNVFDFKEIESELSSFMNERQLQIIAFWSSLEDEKGLSEQKRRFLRVWEQLPHIYHDFRERLLKLGIAYSGMIQRSAVERLTSGEFRFACDERYAMIGFNALSKCESFVVDSLAKVAHVDFFWDYDAYYTHNKDQEAGLFLRENIKKHGERFATSHNNFSAQKELNVVSAASNVLQCKYASKIISELLASGRVDKNTAIVLTDENLLTPLLYALPAEAGKINVTMGYPIKQSLAYSLIERLLSLQNNLKGRKGTEPKFYHVDIVALLSHPYVNALDPQLCDSIEKHIADNRLISISLSQIVEQCSPQLASLFELCTNWESLSQYLLKVISIVARHPYSGEDSFRRVEFLATISESLSTLQNSLRACDIALSTKIYISLLRRLLQSLRVPFEGEPLEGLQVMGILETRNLDFRNVIILSMNDDNFPGNRMTSPSYIPYNFRAFYGVPTAEHHEGVFAYYFYRLIQRAERVWMVYCSHADDKTTGEASRYIYQLDYESGVELKRTDVGVDVNLDEPQRIEIAKVGEVDKLLSAYTAAQNPSKLSPSALNRYIACPLRFYFHDIARIRTSNDLVEDVDSSMFGNILHDAIHTLYTPFIGGGVATVKIGELRTEQRAKIEAAVLEAIYKECKISDQKSPLPSDLLLVKDIVIKYIADGVMAYDAATANLRIEGAEQTHSHELALGSNMRVMIEGTLDRVDRLEDGSLRVVDYKSGGKHLEFKSIEALFEGAPAERRGHITQTLTYSMILSHATGQAVVPSLFYVRFMHNGDYSPLLIEKSNGSEPIRTYEQCAHEFEQALSAKLSELFDRSIPFSQAEKSEGTCDYCDFRQICRV